MKKENYKKILSLINETDIVVDIGGWEKPFNRANYVLDVMPYETRKKKKGFPAEMLEHFSKETWLNTDICEEKLPFSDKQIDFIICGHVLEDIKDPMKLCREMMRVSKAGYIESPSRAIEMNSSIDPYMGSHRYVGYCHHRWFVELIDNTLIFTPKTLVHSAVKSLRIRKVKSDVVSFFWNDKFNIKEIFFSSFDDMIDDALKFKMKNDSKSKQNVYYWYNIERTIFKPIAGLRSLIKRKIVNHG